MNNSKIVRYQIAFYLLILSAPSFIHAMIRQLPPNACLETLQPKEQLSIGRGLVRSKSPSKEDLAQGFACFQQIAEQTIDEESAAWANVELAKLFYFKQIIDKDKTKLQECLRNACSLAQKNAGLKEILAICAILSDAKYEANSKTGGYFFSRPLHDAVKGGNKELVRILVEKKADVNGLDNDGRRSPLHYALVKGHKDIALFLIDSRARVDIIDDDGISILHSAASFGDVEIVRALFSSQAKKCLKASAVDGADKHASTPLAIAVGRGHVATVKFLLPKSTQINRVLQDCTLLQIAAGTFNKTLVEMLIDHGALIQVVTKTGNPLHEIFRMLFSSNHRSDRINDVLLSGIIDLIKFLIEKGADVNGVDSDGDTLLHKIRNLENSSERELAARTLLPVLFSKGINVNARNNRGESALHVLASEGSIEVIKDLIVAGADVEAIDNNGDKPWQLEDGLLGVLYWSPIHCAAYSLDKEFVKQLLDKGAQVNALTKHHDTPLHIAAYALSRVHKSAQDAGIGEVQAANLIELLISKGGNVNLLNSTRRTPLQLLIDTFYSHVDSAFWVLRDPSEYVAKKSSILYERLQNLAKLLDYETKRDALFLAAKNDHAYVIKFLLANCAFEVKDLVRAVTELIGNRLDNRGDFKALIDKIFESRDTVLHNDNASLVELLSPELLASAVKKGDKEVVDALQVPEALRALGLLPVHAVTLLGNEGLIKIAMYYDSAVNSLSHNVSIEVEMTNSSNNLWLRMSPELCNLATEMLSIQGVDTTEMLTSSNLQKPNFWITSLHCAAFKGDREIMKFLLEKGADLHAKTLYGWTALDFARKKGHRGVVELLLERGASQTYLGRINDAWLYLRAFKISCCSRNVRKKDKKD